MLKSNSNHAKSEEAKNKQKQIDKNKTVKEKYVVIDVKNRGKKHYTTTVSGLNNFGTSTPTQPSIAKIQPKNVAKNSQFPAQPSIKEQSNSKETTLMP